MEKAELAASSLQLMYVTPHRKQIPLRNFKINGRENLSSSDTFQFPFSILRSPNPPENLTPSPLKQDSTSL